MTLSRRNPRRDANEAEIVGALRAVGVEVWPLSGKGVGDLLTRFRGRELCIEIKTETGKLRTTQGDFPIVRSVEQALELVCGVKPRESR